MSIVVPAVLPSSRDDLEEKLALYIRIPHIKRIQIDVVDGRFAEPASWPYTAPEEILAMRHAGKMLPSLERIAYEIDLMCIDVERAASDWLMLGATRLTFHGESAADLPRLLAFMKERYGSGAGFATGLISFGVALNIESDLALLEPSIHEIEYVQFMGIAHIGRQGELFDERVLEKVRSFRTRHPDVAIQIDGGVSLQNAKKLLSLGVTDLVIGSAISRSPNPAAAVAAFEELENSYGV